MTARTTRAARTARATRAARAARAATRVLPTIRSSMTFPKSHSTKSVSKVTGVKRQNRGSPNGKGGAVGVLVLLVFLSAVLASCRETRRVDELRPLAVGTAEAQIKQVTKTVSYVGTVHSETEVTVLARVAGRVRVLPFNEGARVKKGQVVARLASPDLAAGV